MSAIRHRFLFYVLLIFPAFLLRAQQTPILWKAADPALLERNMKGKREIIPAKAFTFTLEYGSLLNTLNTAPMRFSDFRQEEMPKIILPMPDGTARTFSMMEASVMHPDLQKQYPRIRSYAGFDVNNPSSTIRLSVSHKGLAAMVLDTDRSTFIDSYENGSVSGYISYDKTDFSSDKKMSCALSHDEEMHLPDFSEKSFRTGDGFMRKYRLALACTGEYAQYHGGKVENVLAAMNKSMTRVNGVYEKEFSITMELVPNNTKLIFLNATTDGYTNNNGSTMLGENQQKCDALIGNTNYDIGHVFSTGGGGIANLGSPCTTNNKAKGVTGSPNPVGDPFDIDYVCHEMGHQYGAQHTFNNTCSGNISANSAYEPGSGSTIMGYAGVCTPSIQPNSDAYFHAISVAQINQYTTSGTGNNCPVKLQTSNLNEPDVNAGDDFTIPKETPFELTGFATDVESPASNLSYCWEQYDREQVTMPPTGSNNTGPLFRSLSPQKSAVRVFPTMNNVVKNTKNTWEAPPKVARTINFRLTVRDNDINGGRSGLDAMKVTVADSGPFKVTYPDETKIAWISGSSETVTWDVAQTNVAPISTALVMILLSSDGGYTYPDTLAKAVPNSGNAVIKVPFKNISRARIKIKGVNNIFFDISNNDFVIQKPLVPSFAFGANPGELKICLQNKDSVQIDLAVNSVAGYKQVVKLSASSLPAAARYSFSKDTITPGGSVKLTIFNLRNAGAGSFSPVVMGESGSITDSISFPLIIFGQITQTPEQLRPLQYSRGVGLKSPFVWRKMASADRYTIEISKTPDFSIIDETATVSDTQYVATKTTTLQIYHWRIRGINPCNSGSSSQVFSFQTGVLLCDTLRNNNALNIPIVAAEVSSKIDISRKGILGDLEVYTKIDHPYLSDLEVQLQNPNGEQVTLFSGACSDRNNVDATFSESGNNLSCALSSPAIRNRIKPRESFSVFYNDAFNGTWTLKIRDKKLDDGGTLLAWNLRVCRNFAPDSSLIVETDTLRVTEGQLKNIGDDLISATSIGLGPDKITYKITRLPANGTLRRGTSAMTIGSTITQQQINTGSLFYLPETGKGATEDSFGFETLTSIGGWVPNNDFPIRISANKMKIVATLLRPIRCHGDRDAQVSLSATGGAEPVQYKLDDKPFGFYPVFDSLRAGTYQVTAKDNDGVSSYFTLKISEPAPITASIVKDSSNIKLFITGGTPPYLINYDNSGFSPNNGWNNQPNGLHSFVIRDSSGCIYTDSFRLSVNPLRIVYGTQRPSCSNSADGKISVNMDTGTAPYSYKLNQNPAQNTSVFDGLQAGTYLLSVSDATGFSRAIKVELTGPAPLLISTRTSGDSLFLEATGGTAPYLYSIDDGKNYKQSSVFPGLSNGTYQIALQDANGCMLKKTHNFTSIAEASDDAEIRLFPNPATAFAEVIIENGTIVPLQITVVNAQAQIISSSEMKAGESKHRLNTENLAAGFYSVIISGKGVDRRFKLLIMK